MKWIKTMLMLTVAFISFKGISQDISVSLMDRQFYYLYPTDLFNLVIENQSSNNVQVYLKAEVKNTKQHTLVSIVSGQLNLNPGLNTVTKLNVSVERVTYQDHDLNMLTEKLRSLPSGSYIACVGVMDMKENQILATDCQEVNIELFSPPHLVSPLDGSEIEDANPVLTWIPPTPITDQAYINYKLQLVELLDGQNAYSAQNSNPLFYKAEDLKPTIYQYPFSAINLKKGKSYAWKISAYFNDYFIGESESWAFTFKPSEDKTDDKATYFAELKKERTGGYHRVQDGVLRFNYYEEYSVETGKLDYRLYKDGQPAPMEDLPDNLITKGDNYYMININGEGGIDLANGYYVLEIISPKQESRFIKFKVEM